jgi:hypothetical protein
MIHFYMHCQNINPKANLRITTPDNTAREHTLAGDCGKFSQPGEHIRVQKKKFEPRYLVSYCSKTRCKLRTPSILDSDF